MTKSTTTLWAKAKDNKTVSEFICDFDGYVTLLDDKVQSKIVQMENIGYHSFSTTVVYD